MISRAENDEYLDSGMEAFILHDQSKWSHAVKHEMPYQMMTTKQMAPEDLQALTCMSETSRPMKKIIKPQGIATVRGDMKVTALTWEKPPQGQYEVVSIPLLFPSDMSEYLHDPHSVISLSSRGYSEGRQDGMMCRIRLKLPFQYNTLREPIATAIYLVHATHLCWLPYLPLHLHHHE